MFLLARTGASWRSYKKCSFRSKIRRCLVDSSIKRAFNHFVSNVLLLVCVLAKLNECLLFGSYSYAGNKSTISVATEKIQRYPLFVNRNINLQVSRIGLMHLHNDLLRLLISLGVSLSLKRLRLKDSEDLVKLILLLTDFYC